MDHYQDVKQELDVTAEDLTRLDYYTSGPVQVEDNLPTALQLARLPQPLLLTHRPAEKKLLQGLSHF